MGTAIRLLLLLLSTGLCGTSCVKQVAVYRSAVGVSGPRCLVYKTRGDYALLVPVTLSDDKSRVVSFPDVKDINYNGKPAYPTPLSGGYLLDNRGITPGVAFLKTTYEEYGRMKTTPSAGELYNLVIDKDPLVELYDCGSRTSFADPAEAMDSLIRAGKLAGRKRLR
ncbi:MAG: hypothetical protein WCK34_13680 [Bacteroidota bacterium]